MRKQTVRPRKTTRWWLCYCYNQILDTKQHFCLPFNKGYNPPWQGSHGGQSARQIVTLHPGNREQTETLARNTSRPNPDDPLSNRATVSLTFSNHYDLGTECPDIRAYRGHFTCKPQQLLLSFAFVLKILIPEGSSPIVKGKKCHKDKSRRIWTDRSWLFFLSQIHCSH